MKKRSITMCGALALFMLPGSGAFASSNGTGGDVSDGRTPNSQQAIEKLALAEAFVASVDAMRGVSTASSASRGISLEKLSSAYVAKYGKSSLPSALAQSPAVGSAATISSSAISSLPTSVYLSNYSAGQQTDYWCGPATGRNILKHYGKASKMSSAHTTSSQRILASKSYMETDVPAMEKATSFDKGQMERGLNRWRNGAGTGFYVRVAQPTQSQLYNAHVTAAMSDELFAVSTVEFRGSKARYNRHPVSGATIGHWITAYGYSDSGQTVHYADPAWNVDKLGDRWQATPPAKTFKAKLSTMIGFVETNGFVW